MAKETTPAVPADHKEKKPTRAELDKLAEAEFIQKYNALCEEYGMSIIPNLTLNVKKN